MDRLALFLAATDTTDDEHVALRALTLHMLDGLKPGSFPTALLDDALNRCADVGFDFDSNDPDRLQAGIDAWFLRHVRGLPHQKPDAERLHARLRDLANDGFLIYSWLLGEIAARCGVDARISITGTRPFEDVSRLHHTYWLTHLPLLDSDYFAKPVTHPDAAKWADELELATTWLAREPNDDLAGEVALCLSVLGRDASAARALLNTHRPPDEPHAQATALLAFTVA
ncbi:MAG: hypothetical protein ACO1OB_12690 [Archangium sp.]